jgi:hypothetical protein
MDSTNEQLEEKHFVTPQEIEKDKLPPEEILSLPMFKVHIANELSCHLHKDLMGNPGNVIFLELVML